MRRALNGIASYFAGLAGATAAGWNRFFFTPADPTALGVARVVVGLLLFWNLAVLGLDLKAYFGSEGWVNPATVSQVLATERPFAWTFWTRVPDALLWPVWGVCMSVFLLFTIGLWSRVTAALSWVIVVSTVNRLPVAVFGFDQIISTLTLYLAVTGASGQAVSLDRFLARWKQVRSATARRLSNGRWPLGPGVPEPTVSANLSLRLMQLHLCLIYGMAGLAKLQGPAWWNGMAIWGTLASGEFNVMDFTRIARYPWLLNVLTHAALATELFYPVLIWVRPVRPLVLLSAVLLHFGIGITSPGLAEFGLAMLALNLAFVSGPWLRSLVVGLDPSKPAVRVLYDGACPRCRASISFVTAADPDRLIDPIDLTAVDVRTVHPSLTPDACMKAMHLVRDDGGVVSGFDAVMALGRVLPPFWPFAMFGSLPVVRTVGRRVYQIVADSRPRDVPCTDEVCGIHSGPKPAHARGAPSVDVARTSKTKP